MNNSCLTKAQGRPRPNPWYGHTTNTHPPPCHIPGSQAISPSLPLLCPSLVFSYSLPPTPRLICYQCICRKFRIRGVDNLIFKRFFRLTAKTQGLHMLPCENIPQSIKNRRKSAENQGSSSNLNVIQASSRPHSTNQAQRPLQSPMVTSFCQNDVMWHHWGKSAGEQVQLISAEMGGWKNLFNIKLSPS